MRTLACCLALSWVTLAPAAAPPVYSPDLPGGARLRLGAARWQVPFDKTARVPFVLSADRKRFAAAPGPSIDLYDVATGRRLFQLENRGTVFFPLAFSHDGETLAVTRVDVAQQKIVVDLWPVTAAERPRTLRVSGAAEPYTYPIAAAFLPGNKQLATYDAESLVVWDIKTNQPLRCDRVRAAPDAASFSPDGRLFACQVGASVVLHDLTSGKWRRIALPLPPDGKAFAAWSWSGDGRALAIVNESGQAFVHDTATGRLVRRLLDKARVLAHTAFSPDGRALAVQGEDALRVYDVRRGALLRTMKATGVQMAFRDEHRLLVIGESGQGTTWDVRTGQRTDVGRGHRGAVSDLAFARDGRTLVSVGTDDQLIRWDVKTGRPLDRMALPVGKSKSRHRMLSLSDDGRAAVVTDQGGEGMTSVLDVQRRRAGWQGQKVPRPQEMGSALGGALGALGGGAGALGGGGGLLGGGGFGAFGGVPFYAHGPGMISPDGSLIAMPVTQDDAIRVQVRRADGSRPRHFGACREVRQAFSPDSRELALSGKEDNRCVVRLHDLHLNRLRLTLKAGEEDDTIRVLECSADGRVVAADARNVYVWERASGAKLSRTVLPKGFEPVQAVVTPAGRVLLLGSRPGPRPYTWEAIVWDVAKAEAVRTAPFDYVICPRSLCGQGRTLAVCGDDCSILLFDVPQEAPRRTVADEAGRERLWQHLASADAGRAWRARSRLAAMPEAVALLAKRLKPAEARTIEEVADLDDDDFDRREAATKKLADMLRRGDRQVEKLLQDLIDDAPSPEALHRARRLMAKVVPYTAEELRVIRAVGVLEQIGDDEAKALLKRLARGGPYLLATEARAALARLTRE